MNAMILMKKLFEIIEQNPMANVYIYDYKGNAIDFSGFSVDDNNEVTLYETSGDSYA